MDEEIPYSRRATIRLPPEELVVVPRADLLRLLDDVGFVANPVETNVAKWATRASSVVIGGTLGTLGSLSRDGHLGHPVTISLLILTLCALLATIVLNRMERHERARNERLVERFCNTLDAMIGHGGQRHGGR